MNIGVNIEFTDEEVSQINKHKEDLSIKLGVKLSNRDYVRYLIKQAIDSKCNICKSKAK